MAPSGQPKAKADMLGTLDRGRRNTSRIRQICLHTTENVTGTKAENIINYQNRTRSGSYNIMVDNTRGGYSIRHNDDDFGSWGTGGPKDNDLLNISMVTYAGNSRQQWLAANDMLEETARICAGWCKAYGIPVKKLSHAELRNNIKGFCHHDDISKVFKTSTHWDVGPSFPWDVFFQKVNAHLAKLNGSTQPAPSTPPPAPKDSDTEKMNALHRLFTTEHKSLVAGSTYRATLGYFIRLIDAALYRTERKVDQINIKLDSIIKDLEDR